MEKFNITFLPEGKTVVVDKGTTLLAAALSAHIHLNSGCGGDGVCGKCRVIVKAGDVHAGPSGRITPQERGRGVYLACQALVMSDLDVEVPMESRLDLNVLSRGEQEARLRGVYAPAEPIEEAKSVELAPVADVALVQKFFFKLPKPNLDDKLSDLERVIRAVQEKVGQRPVRTGLANIRHLGALLRSGDYQVTVTVFQKEETVEILSVEPGDRSTHHYAFVFDIGTTTITGQLVDLAGRWVLGTKVTYNRQATFGSDVITRIIYAQEHEGLEKLHHAVVDVMNEMIEQFVAEHNVDLNDVTCVSVAGNTTMIHLLLKIDPTHIRQEPYVPTANAIPVVRAAEAGLKIQPHGLLFCVPGVASYVGGDITAGIVACDMHRSKEVRLLIDIGTNGEIALGHSEWMMSCAASAGPAFEGSGMSCGLRAVRGAIQGMMIKDSSLELNLMTIGNDKPRGICGSGYIEAVAELLCHRIVDKNGRIDRTLKNRRVRPSEQGYEFVLVFAQDSATGNDIVITDADLDNLKRAKAAIYSGIAVLLRHMNMRAEEVAKVYVAGGFGTSLSIESAVQIGLLPDIPRGSYAFVGNSSLAGARLNLFSVKSCLEAEATAANTTYFELSSDPAYIDEYMAALFFPHTDITRFASVKYDV